MFGADVLGYIGAGGLLVVAPGPDFVVVMRSGLGGGRRAASAAGLGVATGFFIWSIAVATGLGAILATSAHAYTAVKVFGVAYLLYLGVSSLRAAFARSASGDNRDGEADGAASVASVHDGDESPRPTDEQESYSSSYRQGVLTNVLNPKVAVTFLSLMPQFLPRHPSGTQLAVLCVVTLAIGLVWFQWVALMVGGLRRFFARPRIRRVLEGATGVVLVGLGARLAVD
jgi:threonine/homoserine/homoserine lactone efflux protein